MLGGIFGKASSKSAVHDGGSDELDEEVTKETLVKPAPKINNGSAKEASNDMGEESSILSGKAETKRERTITKEKAAAAQSIAKPKEKKYEDNGDEYSDADQSGSSESDVEPVDVLLQFIPYYGQGDPANDSIVRSTLSALSVEDIDSKDEYGNTLLLLACQYRCEDLVRIMLNKGADANALNSSGACCLHFACYRESASINVAKILLKSGADPDVAESTFGCTPLHYCAGTGDVDFCKLLLSYGAQINALDYYNYTCVDYATEAGMTDVATFLQKKLDAVNKKFGLSSQSFRGSPNSPSGKGGGGIPDNDISNWESHIDPDSGGKYYIHIKTGECLWESELKQRLQLTVQQNNLSISSRDENDLTNITSDHSSRPMSANTNTIGNKISEADLIHQAFQARLIVFFTTHDPERLSEIDLLIEKYTTKETELLQELCTQYNIDNTNELQAFQKQIQDLRPTLSTSKQSNNTHKNSVKTGIAELDPLQYQTISYEERKRFEIQLQEETIQLKKKYDLLLEDEKANFIHLISEKEGQIAKLKSEIESLDRGKSSTEVNYMGFIVIMIILYGFYCDYYYFIWVLL